MKVRDFACMGDASLKRNLKISERYNLELTLFPVNIIDGIASYGTFETQGLASHCCHRRDDTDVWDTYDKGTEV